MRHHDRATHRPLRRGVVGRVDLGDGPGLGVGDLLAGLVGAAEERRRRAPRRRRGRPRSRASRRSNEPCACCGVRSAEARGTLGGLAEMELVVHAPSIGHGEPDMRSWQPREAYHPIAMSEIGSPRRDRVAVRQGRAHGARDDRRRPRIDLSAARRPAAGAGGGRTGREPLGRVPRGRRGRHGSRGDGGGSRASRRLGPHRGRRRGLGPRARMQRRDRGLHRTRGEGRRGRRRAPLRPRGGAPDQRVTVVESSNPASSRARGSSCDPDGTAEGSLGDAAVDAEAVPGRGGAPGRGAIRGPHARRGRPRVRRGPRPAAAVARLRRRARRDPARPRGVGARMERHRRRRPPRVPHAAIGSPKRAGFVAVDDPGRRGEGGRGGRAHVRRRDVAPLPPRQGVRPLDARIAGRLPRDARARRQDRAPARGAPRGRRRRSETPDRRRIHGPAGLDLGGEGPEEIAQAIVAEIVAVKRRRAGGFLRDRPGPIHDRPRPGTEARSAATRKPARSRR